MTEETSRRPPRRKERVKRYKGPPKKRHGIGDLIFISRDGENLVKFRTGIFNDWQSAPRDYASRPQEVSLMRKLDKKTKGSGGSGYYLTVQDPENSEVTHFYRDRDYIGTQNSHLLRTQERGSEPEEASSAA